MTIKVLLRFRLKERVVHSIGFTQKKDKLEFARRAGGQVVTSVVCNRSQPDPLGIVLWRDKLEFGEFPETPWLPLWGSCHGLSRD